MDGIIFIANFINNPDHLFDDLKSNNVWDESMTSRKTASFGVAYNYSQLHYPYKEIPPSIATIRLQLKPKIGFLPNNCLINLYPNGTSKMGYHSDQTTILHPNTGIAIVSLGATRILRFRKIDTPEEKIDFSLPKGSLIYMPQSIQHVWQHAIPKSKTEDPRMSLTFRSIQ